MDRADRPRDVHQTARSTELLPGEDPELLPGPDQVELFSVVDQYISTRLDARTAPAL